MLIILLCILVTVAIAGYFVYNIVIDYAGDKAINMLVTNQIEGMLASGEITLEELEEIIIEPADESVEVTPTVSEKEEKTPEVSKQKKEEQNSAPAQKPKTEKETVKAASEKITDTISREERTAMLRLISTRLTKEDVKVLSALAAGGLEGEEISQAYRIAKSRFTDEEIVQVKTYWHRYKSTVLKSKPKEEAREKK